MKLLALFSLLIGIVLLIIGVVYIITPAHALPAFFPGHDASLIKPHIKHGIGAFLLAFACFAFAWFNTGKKSSHK